MTNKPIKLGVTGSIGMGKTFVALELSKKDYPLWNSDTVVHNLYKKGRPGYEIIKNLIPSVATGLSVNRDLLAKEILRKPSLLNIIENKIHPIIDEERIEFLNLNYNADIVVFDIPLLFETGCNRWLDYVIVVTAPFDIQKRRVLSRKEMTEEKFLYIISKQLSNDDKICRADFVVNTNQNYKLVSADISKILSEIKNEHN